jgi:DNA invertase Pin-like site-specific DNA recombinase
LIDDELKENDLLMVAKIDWSSRNILEFLKLQERFHKKEVTFLSLDLLYSNDITVNKLIGTSFAGIATFEKNVDDKEFKLLKKCKVSWRKKRY